MIAIRGLAVFAIVGVAAIAAAPRSEADSPRETFEVRFRYDASQSTLDNYVAFARKAERACSMPGVLGLAQRNNDRLCVEGVLEQLVNGMGRPELADVHQVRTGGRAESSRTLAAR